MTPPGCLQPAHPHSAAPAEGLDQYNLTNDEQDGCDPSAIRAPAADPFSLICSAERFNSRGAGAGCTFNTFLKIQGKVRLTRTLASLFGEVHAAQQGLEAQVVTQRIPLWAHLERKQRRIPLLVGPFKPNERLIFIAQRDMDYGS